jgi:hypothetical protein
MWVSLGTGGFQSANFRKEPGAVSRTRRILSVFHLLLFRRREIWIGDLEPELAAETVVPSQTRVVVFRPLMKCQMIAMMAMTSRM